MCALHVSDEVEGHAFNVVGSIGTAIESASWQLALKGESAMNQSDFTAFTASRRKTWFTLLWPEVRKRLKQRQSPGVIASEMAREGFRGFNSSRIGVPDIHRLCELAGQYGDADMESTEP